MRDTLRLSFMVLLILGVGLTGVILESDEADDLTKANRTANGADDLVVKLVHWTNEVTGNQGQRTDAECERRLEAIDRRMAEKTRITRDLIEGHITLCQAATHFRRLNAAYPVPPPNPMAVGDSDEERLYWEVIGWTRRTLLDRYPDRYDEQMARFDEELRLHKESLGRQAFGDGKF